ncbi:MULTISPECIES: hypothetical protein [Bacillus cereus group]|uniref:hypothetical protein n=1 Tax=Bacillus cereus group TaxID=86661 RepID=UPI003D1B72E7
MKEVNMYVRVNQVRGLDLRVIKYIGCLLLEYGGKHKYVFIEDIPENQQRRAMLWVVGEGLGMLKESCKIGVHSLNKLFEVEEGRIIPRKKYSDLGDKLTDLVESGGHIVECFRCNSEDTTDERSEVFKKFNSELKRYKRQYKKA